MTNISKLSKVMLLAGALVFASFYSTDASAQKRGEIRKYSYEGKEYEQTWTGTRWNFVGLAKDLPLEMLVQDSIEQDNKELQETEVVDLGMHKDTKSASRSARMTSEYLTNQQANNQAKENYNKKVANAQQEVQRQKSLCQQDAKNCDAYKRAQENLQKIQNPDVKQDEKKYADYQRYSNEYNQKQEEYRKQSTEAWDRYNALLGLCYNGIKEACSKQNEAMKAAEEIDAKAKSELDKIKKDMDNSYDDISEKYLLELSQEKLDKVDKDLESAQRKAASEIAKTQKKVDKKIKNANKDIEKYCGGKKANPEKCEEAQKALQEAQQEQNRLDVSKEALSGEGTRIAYAEQKRDAQVEANKEEIDRLEKEIVSCDDKTGKQKEACLRTNKEKSARIAELTKYNKGVEQAKLKEALADGAELVVVNPEVAAGNLATAQGNYTTMKNKYSEAANNLAKCYAEKGRNGCAEEQAALAEAKEAADNAYKEQVKYQKEYDGLSDEQKKLSDKHKAETDKKHWEEQEKLLCTANKENSQACLTAKKELAAAETALKQAKKDEADAKLKNLEEVAQAKQDEYDSLKAQLAEAQAACEYSSGLTSKAGKADAEKYCAQAAQLEDKVKKAADELDEARAGETEARELAESLDDPNLDSDHTGQVYQAVSTAKNDLFSGQYVGGGEFSNSTDIFKTMTKRAMRILVGLKPIVYTFAGFGLIGFAWMAIFNKISWKWFSNIAISLFLVANMGRFIEYFVYPDINGEVQAQKLAFGDYLSRGYADTDYVWIDEQSAYMPPELLGEEEIPDVGIDVPEAKKYARGFCQAEKKGGGLFGGGGFMSCVKDIVAAGKKAVDTVKKVQDTVNTVKSTVEQVKFAAENIGNAAKMIGKGNLEDSFKALGQIGQNVNAMIGASGGMVNGIMSNVSAITNNVQDMTKSRDQVAELNEKRARGEATNKIDAALKGQKMDASGNVERLWGGIDKNGNQKQGAIAGNSNFLTGLQDTTNNIVDKSKKLNSQYQDAMSTVGNFAEGVGNFSAFGSKTINQKLQEKQAEKRAKENKKYQQEQEAQRDTKKAAAQNLAAGQELANNQASSTPNQNNYDAAVRDADKAEIIAKNKEAAADNAEKKSQAKQQTADKLKAEAEAAEARAKNSGSVEDQKAAELARQRANIAEAEAKAAKSEADNSRQAAEKAKNQADEAQKEANSLRGNAVSEGIDKAKDTQTQADATIDNANNVIEENTQKIAGQQQAVEDADAALQEAINKAKQSGSEDDYREVGRLQNEKKQAEAALKQTQQNISKAEADKAAAEKAKNQAMVDQARLEAEQNAGLTQEKLQQMQEDDKQAERLRQEYARNSTASAQAKAAESKAAEAQVAAENAKMEAERKAQAAERAKAEAEAAAKKAQESGSLEDQKAAELAQKRADLAEAEAEAAQEKIDPLKQEAKEKAIASIEASIKEAQYLQTYYQNEMDDADTEIGRLRGLLSIEESNVNIARQGYNEALERAKELNTTEAILAAKAAADKLAEAQEALRKLQKDLERQMLRRNNAEKNLYNAEEREAELKKQKRELEK